jgi:hypothetical protein
MPILNTFGTRALKPTLKMRKIALLFHYFWNIFRLQQYSSLFPALYAGLLPFYTKNPLFKQISADGLL